MLGPQPRQEPSLSFRKAALTESSSNRTDRGNPSQQLCRAMFAALLDRGYWVSTVGRDESVIREYIRKQEQEDTRLEQINLWR